MAVTLVVEGFADGANTAIHHVAGADQISASRCLGDRLLAEDFNGFVVENDALIADDAVMAITGVGIERHVGHHRHAGVLLFDAPNRPGD